MDYREVGSVNPVLFDQDICGDGKNVRVLLLMMMMMLMTTMAGQKQSRVHCDHGH